MTRREWIASDVSGIGLSAIKDMAMRAARIPDARSLTWGLPSFQTPQAIRDAVAEALNTDPEIGKYTLPNGLPELRIAVARVFEARSGVAVDPETEVIATAGNMEGVSFLLRTILDPGDEIIVTDPCFASHLLQIRLCHGKPVFLELDENSGWQLDPDDLEGLITPRTKAILLVSPHNPTGVVFASDTLQALGRVADRHGLLVILDDPYSPFAYGPEPGSADPTVIRRVTENVAYLFTFSKAYAMSGWRAGYMVLPPELRAHALKVHDATMICAPHVAQSAALAALSDLSRPTEDFRRTLDQRRRLIMARLDQMPEIFDYIAPQGAYYVFPKVRSSQVDSRAFSIELLGRTGVAVTPGAAFGPSGEGHVRMAYCVDSHVIDDAFDRLERHFRSSG